MTNDTQESLVQAQIANLNAQTKLVLAQAEELEIRNRESNSKTSSQPTNA